MSGPPCSTCARPDLADLHRAVDATSSNAAAKHYKIPRRTLDLHLLHRDSSPAPARTPPPPLPPKIPPAGSPAPVKAVRLPQGGASLPPQEPTLPPDDLDGRIRQLAGEVDRLREAASVGALRDRANALNACRGAVAALAKLHQEREQGREPELLTSKAWQAVRGKLVDALRPFPEALAAVLAVEFDG